MPALSPSCPHPESSRPGSPQGPNSSRFHASNSQEPDGAERPSQAQPLAIKPRRLRGLPAPGSPEGTRPGMPPPATLRQLGHPIQVGLRNSPPPSSYLPGALPAREHGPRGRTQGSSAKGPSEQTHLPPAPPSAPPRHSPFLGRESAGFAV